MIFKEFFKDNLVQLLFFIISLTMIVWTIQAVNFLDFITSDGHGFDTYLKYTFLNIPKIINGLLPFTFFLTLFYQLLKYDDRNELLIFWSNGINYINFTNKILIFSLSITIFQIILGSIIVPFSQDKARSFIRESNIDYFPNLFKEKKFIDVMKNLTIYAEKKIGDSFEGIMLKENFSENSNKNSRYIFAKQGQLFNNLDNKYFQFENGQIMKINNNKITNIKFDKIIYDLSKFKTQTTTHRKIQETNIGLLFRCLINNYLYKKSIIIENINCNQSSIKDVNQEINKRIIKPIFIPLIALLCSFILINSKIKKNYKRNILMIFLSSFLILVYSEITIKYSGDNILNFLIFFLFPMFIFISLYSIIIYKYNKN